MKEPDAPTYIGGLALVMSITFLSKAYDEKETIVYPVLSIFFLVIMLIACFMSMRPPLTYSKNNVRTFGLDYGTTYSCIAMIENNLGDGIHAVTLESGSGDRTTASSVTYRKRKDGTEEILVGKLSKNKAVKEYENTFFDAKRLFGRKNSDDIVQKDQAYWPFKIDDDGLDTPVFSSSKHGKKTPKEVCKEIIRVLYNAAKE